ncbi:hypothetical protein [Actinoplanes sp. NPDC048796]|uniref:hypothetical protein n=1 Tax=unclassified Actinoplanes TaxID=2626549 RepID=UPI0033ECCB35
MPRSRRPGGPPPRPREELPQNVPQLAAYVMRLVVQNVLGDWDKTLQLLMLGLLPILSVCVGVVLVLGLVPLNWGLIFCSFLATGLGVSPTRRVVRHMRTRRQRRLTGGATRSTGDETPRREEG